MSPATETDQDPDPFQLCQKRLQQLTPPMLTGLYGRLAQASDERKGLSPKTISYVHSTLHKVLSDAVDAGLLVRT